MSRFLRFHAPSLPATAGSLVSLSGDEAHHLIKVLRLGLKAQVTLFDGAGAEATASVAALTKSTVDLELLSNTTNFAPPFEVTIALAPPKRDFDETITMLAELGIPRIQLLQTDHGEVVSEMKADRLARLMSRVEKVSVAAAKQSGSNFLTQVLPPIQLSHLRGHIVVCEPGALTPLGVAVQKLPVTIAIGPEGGWSPIERSFMATKQWSFASLPGNVLRTGTAAVVAAAIALQTNASCTPSDRS